MELLYGCAGSVLSGLAVRSSTVGVMAVHPPTNQLTPELSIPAEISCSSCAAPSSIEITLGISTLA